MQQEFILTLSCPDQRGIVHRVSGFLVEQGCNILDSAQYGDLQSDTYFMRIHFAAETPEHSLDGLRTAFAPVAEAMHMKWEMHDAHHKPRVVIFVSRIGHCLNDLLFRYRSGLLPVEICAIISNHADFYQLAASYNIPFHHFLASRCKRCTKAGTGSADTGSTGAASDRISRAGAVHANIVRIDVSGAGRARDQYPPFFSAQL
jgi:formyltetrahydrofolate hydrolase